ncbi:MAG TPA: cobalamin-independent methionine synthase II family protein [Xanthobacteraceae bacterium]|nr:cobalamin-independent methionine synthase II family protein [Xanthobacteraceae bacterium]
MKTLRVDQVGGLGVAAGLRRVFEAWKSGKAGVDEFERAKDEAVRAVIAKQEAIGFPILTDGELRRRNFQESFSESVSGFDVPAEDKSMEGVSVAPMVRAEQNFAAPGPAIRTRRPVVERLRLKRNVPLGEYQFSSKLAARPVKVTVLSPDRISQRFDWQQSKTVYADMDAFLADVVAITRQIISGLVEAGCRYIQIDAPGYTAYVDKVSLDRMRARGEDPDENMARSIAADNATIAGFDGVTFGIHLCKGNPRTIDPATGKVMPQWHREGHYDAIAERLFSGLKHDRLLLEYDDERSGSFAPLRYVPQGKTVVLGLVTTKRADLESLDLLRRRIDEAVRYLPLEQMALSPQCGFGGLDSISIPEADQWRKFERILETARLVWG